MKPNFAGKTFLITRSTLVIGVIVGTVGVSSAYAAQPGIPAQIAALQDDVQMLQQQVRKLIDQAKTQNTTTGQLTAIVNSQSQLIGQLLQQNQDAQAKLACMSKTGDNVYFTGCNVHVVSGSGATNGPVNGLGNLIVGYNEDAASLSDPPSGPYPPSRRGGSHNLVVGPGHSYTSFGGLVAGYSNSLLGIYASVSGGGSNTASGPYSSVSGGLNNTASDRGSSVSGGWNNTASRDLSSVSGGGNNTAKSPLSSVSGGFGNTAENVGASVSGGTNNKASNTYASVSGGTQNVADGENSSVSGGQGNRATGAFSSVSGGFDNTASGRSSSVSGGTNNTASGERLHSVSGSSVSGGSGNTASGVSSSVSGGQERTAPNDYNWAAGGLLQSQ